MQSKDRAHVVAVCCHSALVFLVAVSLSLYNEAWGEALLWGGGAIVVPNIWFAWTVRKTGVSELILIRNIVRFVMYAALLVCGLSLGEASPGALVAAAIGTHILYVVIVAIFGSRQTVKKVDS